MPTQAVTAYTMEVGKKGKGKHWTAKEVEARARAAEDFERKDDSKIEPPIWLSKAARLVWDKKVAEIHGLNAGSGLLDALDSEVLALFCDAIVMYQKIAKRKRLKVDDHKLLQTYMLRILGYSERLGFTPGARARLIKKRAEGGEKDEFGEKFD
ncbi:MAG: P27 family phage terminase small subunit [Anaerolineae bacterium]|nr:P27 family phage terminase small subunit [Anaerolineae bacterium]